MIIAWGAEKTESNRAFLYCASMVCGSEAGLNTLKREYL